MNDTQLYLTIGIPTIAVIPAWFSNKTDISSLRADNSTLCSELISLRRKIYEALVPLHERMAVIEVKQK